MTKENALLNCFQYLEEWEKEMSILHQQPFLKSKPYQVVFEHNTVAVHAWGHLEKDLPDSKKYGIKFEYKDTIPNNGNAHEAHASG